MKNLSHIEKNGKKKTKQKKNKKKKKKQKQKKNRYISEQRTSRNNRWIRYKARQQETVSCSTST